MAEKITHSICVGGPIRVHTVDGVIRRIRPIFFDENDPNPWKIEARGRTFSPPRNTTVSLVALQEKGQVRLPPRHLGRGSEPHRQGNEAHADHLRQGIDYRADKFAPQLGPARLQALRLQEIFQHARLYPGSG